MVSNAYKASIAFPYDTQRQYLQESKQTNPPRVLLIKTISPKLKER